LNHPFYVLRWALIYQGGHHFGWCVWPGIINQAKRTSAYVDSSIQLRSYLSIMGCGQSSVVAGSLPPPIIHDSVLTTIGKTPLIKLSAKTVIAPGVNVYVKCEMFNPMGSVKGA
jgi:hypothetical protein